MLFLRTKLNSNIKLGKANYLKLPLRSIFKNELIFKTDIKHLINKKICGDLLQQQKPKSQQKNEKKKLLLFVGCSV